MIEKKTKIVATIGPVTESVETLALLAQKGLNICRMNMSHGDLAEHGSKMEHVRAAVAQTGIHLEILQDLAGPKIRTGEFYTDRIMLTEGSTFTFMNEPCVGDETKAFITYPNLYSEVVPGTIIMLDDGKKKLEVVEVRGTDIVTKVIIGGETKGRRGVNIVGADLKISCLTEKDRTDLLLGVERNVEYMALSFVRKAEDIYELRQILKDAGAGNIKIISKIETPQALEHLDAIIEASDGAMVARGDLAIEVGYEFVPSAQKTIIKKCNEAGKLVITATQMLESMIHNPVPTRAEVSDIANAIFDGTDAVMLSEETTLGSHAEAVLDMMTRVIVQAEKDTAEWGRRNSVVI